MAAVVALHCIETMPSALPGVTPPGLVRVLSGFVKFGTIDFFLVSGFLLGDAFERGNPFAFMGRRLQKIGVPWLTWFLFTAVYFTIGKLLRHKLDLSLSTDSLTQIPLLVEGYLTGTAFWFVPNLLLSIFVLLLVRRHFRRAWLGCALFLITLFYAVNIYRGWVPSSHTVALGGYMFFLWLGALGARNYGWLVEKLARVSLWMVVLFVLLAALLATGEANILAHRGAPDPLNTLRLSNQLYSLATIVLILKIQRVMSPAFINVRKEIFGVYLSHSLVLAGLLFLPRRISESLPSYPAHFGAWSFLATAAGVSLLVFVLSIALTQTLSRYALLGWMVGDLPNTGARAEQESAGHRPAPVQAAPVEHQLLHVERRQSAPTI